MRTPARSPLIARLPFPSKTTAAAPSPHWLDPTGLKCIMAGTRPATITSSKKAASIEDRLDLDDRPAVIAADPKRTRTGAIVDEHPADVGRARQLVLDVLAGLHVEAGDAVVQHRAGPGGAVLAGHRVIWRAPGRRRLPFLDLAGLRCE